MKTRNSKRNRQGVFGLNERYLLGLKTVLLAVAMR